MDKNYLYAVANIRANELSLLSRADIDALIDAPDYKTALTLLDGKGYDRPSAAIIPLCLTAKPKKRGRL